MIKMTTGRWVALSLVIGFGMGISVGIMLMVIIENSVIW
jgi:hypothetical protein